MELLAQGRDAHVYAIDGHTVLRRFPEPRDLGGEVAAMECARAAGFPVPAIHEVRADGMVLERVHGPTMLEALLADPSGAEAHAHTLGELHRLLGQVLAPPDLPTTVGEGAALLHLDLHPGNVILGDVPTVIDWTNAARGPAGADPAACWLLTRIVQVDVPGLSPAEQTVLVGAFVETFLDGFDTEELVGHLPAVGEVRLRDPNLSPEELRRIRAFVDDPW
ncbi:phosphotransferase [Ornithinimicrobium cavernae]|uniref:phosphotransferase n=1 Tax=Ornithinimicrobium cavernae TaxID=2666047 RepID=UPI000D691FBF|nr:phosphotransferase [Ornithinimicrobium cavernae]